MPEKKSLESSQQRGRKIRAKASVTPSEPLESATPTVIHESESITKALTISPPDVSGHASSMLKLISLDSGFGITAEFPSKQLRDPFAAVSGYGSTIMMPPYDFDQLATLAESQPIHAAALSQKASDIVADGFNVVPISETADGATTDESQKVAIMEWWESLFDEFTSIEILQSMWLDYETFGWGALEVVRDVDRIVRRLYHVPANTLRAHWSNQVFPQVRQGRIAWFKRYGTPDDYLLSTGTKAPEGTPPDLLTNELLLFRHPARRSTWYGIPPYVAGIGFIAMSIAARDFNVKFFDNYREPRHVIIISGLASDVNRTTTDLVREWKAQLTDNPHKNILVPIAGSAQITIQRMGIAQNDMHFARLMEAMDGEILVSHRIPPDRLGIAPRGFLGGSVTQAVDQIYKDGVVAKSQVILESRLDRFMRAEFAKTTQIDEQNIMFKVDFAELDVSDEQIDVNIAIALVSSNLITLNEGRAKLGMSAHPEFKNMTLAEYAASIAPPAAQPAVLAAAISGGHGLSRATDNALASTEIMNRLSDIDGVIQELLTDSSDGLRTSQPLAASRSS